MLGEWPERPLEELCELIVDCPHSTPKWTDHGVVVLRNQYIRNGRLDLSAPSYTTEEDYESRIKRAVPTAGDIVLTREAPMGEVCKIPDGLRCCLGQRMVLIRPNKKILDPDYLLFAIQSPYVQHQISWSEGTGTTVSNIRLPDLRAFKIPTPSLEIQKTIAGILAALDDKIELNRQINTTLESMAQALFKSWFVDFDPVIDNAQAAGNPIPDELNARAERRKNLRENPGNPHPPLPADIQQLFPSSFVFTEEMGWVPEGWSVNSIGNMVDRFPVGKKFSQKTASEQGTVPVLDQGKSGVIGYHDEEPGVLASPEDPIIVFANHTCYMRLVMHNFSAIQNVLPFKGKSLDIYWLYFATLGKQPFIEYKGHWPDFVIHSLAIPTNGLDSVFGEQVASQIKSIYVREVQNESLGNLRDTILPKLLSGQLQIPEAEQQLAEVV